MSVETIMMAISKALTKSGPTDAISALTAHRVVHAAGPVEGKTVLVQGGAGTVGSFAMGLARQAGARVIATIRSESDREIASRAGANEVLLMGKSFVD